MILPNVGELNRRADFYKVQTRAIGGGKHETTEKPFWSCWAKVEVIGGVVYWDNVQTSEAVTHRIYIRYVVGKTRPQDLGNQIEIVIDGCRYRSKRVTDVNSAGRFTLLECEVLDG